MFNRFNREPDLNPVRLLLKTGNEGKPGKTASLTEKPKIGTVKPVLSLFINTSATVFLTKKIKINKKFCFKFKKKRGFDFENVVKSKPVKSQMPTLTPKISDLLFMT